MAKLVYIINTSIDGYAEDASGALDWANPAQTHEFITNLVRPMRTHICGRRLYETMAYWDTALLDEYPVHYRDFAQVWRGAEKIVFSRTLTEIPPGYSRIERNFDASAIRALKKESPSDMTIGGAELAGLALEAGLLDESHVFVNPVILGAGKPAFRLDARRNLELLETRRFDTGVTHLHYALR